MAADINIGNETDQVVDTSVVTPETPEEDKGEVTQAQSNPHVEKATALGWMPKEEWIAAGVAIRS